MTIPEIKIQLLILGFNESLVSAGNIWENPIKDITIYLSKSYFTTISVFYNSIDNKRSVKRVETYLLLSFIKEILNED